MTAVVRYVLPNLRLGGQAELVLSALTELSRRGVDAAVLLPDGAALEDRACLDRYAREKGTLGALADLPGLRRRVVRLAAGAVVFVVLPSPALLGLGRWIAGDRPAVFHFEGDGSGLRSASREFLGGNAVTALRMVLTHPLLARLCRRPGATLAVGTNAAVSRIRARNPSLSPLLLPQACDWEPPFPDRAEARRKLGIAGDFPIIGFAGHFFVSKGFPVLREAFRRVRERHPECRLLVAASGEGRDPAGGDADSGVLRLGVTDIPAFLRAADVLALPYRTLEATTLPPSLLLEAMAVGVPVVASDFEDLRETAPAGEATFVPPGDAAALAAALERELARAGDREQTVRRQRLRTLELRRLRSAAPLWESVLG